MLWYTQGELERARTGLNRVLELAHAGDMDTIVRAQDLSARVEHALGNLQAAREWFALAVDAFRSLGIPWTDSPAMVASSSCVKPAASRSFFSCAPNEPGAPVFMPNSNSLGIAADRRNAAASPGVPATRLRTPSRAHSGIARTPLRPACRARITSSYERPRHDTRPSPVTATLRPPLPFTEPFPSDDARSRQAGRRR